MKKAVLNDSIFIVNQVIAHTFWSVIILFALSSCAATIKNNKHKPLVIQEQGSFTVGGKVITNPGTFNPYNHTPDGQTFHGDHAYVFYQIPVKARKLPLIFWHGAGQFSKTWETTPDGREGFVIIADLMSQFLKEKGLD